MAVGISVDSRRLYSALAVASSRAPDTSALTLRSAWSTSGNDSFNAFVNYVFQQYGPNPKAPGADHGSRRPVTLISARFYVNESTDNLASSNGGKGAVRARREVLPSNFSKNDSRPLELSGDLLVNNPG